MNVKDFLKFFSYLSKYINASYLYIVYIKLHCTDELVAESLQGEFTHFPMVRKFEVIRFNFDILIRLVIQI